MKSDIADKRSNPLSLINERSGAISKKTVLDLFTSMLRIRMFEDKVVELYPAQEMKCPVHLCIGQEAIPAGVCLNLRKEDYIFSNHRGHGHILAKGAKMGPLFAEFYGKSTGCSRGKGGSMHLIDVENGVLGTSAIVGGGIPMGVGAALASVMKGEKRITVVFFGDGAYDEGAFYESFNFAALKKLPVVFVCENNFYATNSQQAARHPTCRIADTARAFGAPGVCIDGNDPVAVYNAAKESVERAGDGKGPSLIEAKTYRWKGHVGPYADFAAGCRPEDELNEWIEKCPVRGFKEHIIKNGFITEAGVADIAASIKAEIDEALSFALSSPYPEAKELFEHVYHE